MRTKMIVTEEEYDMWSSEMWEHLASEGHRQTCTTCAHYGCCDGLPNSGGKYWAEEEEEK